jgi:hypothetical protein
VTRIDAATREAYRQTEYRVTGPGEVVLRVGEPSRELAQLHRAHQTDCSAFITACNPYGKLLASAVNAQRQQSLAAAIARLGRAALPGIGRHPTGDWPAEASYLVPGLARATAMRLAEQFEQNALLWAGAGAVPELILLR